MSTVVAVKKDNKVIVGADTQISWGNTKKGFADTKHTKLIKYKNYGVFAVVGLAAFDLPLQMFLLDYDIKKVNKLTLFDLFCEFVTFAKTKHLTNSASTDSEFFAAYDLLFCSADKIFHIDSQRSVDEMHRFWALGSGCEYALGAMQAVYKDDFTATQIAGKALDAAGYFDIYTDSKHKHIIEL